MRVLMINVVCGIRSTGRICTDLAEALEAHGHEVKIAYGREEVPSRFKKYAIRIGTSIDNNVHGIEARLFDSCGFGSKRATQQFIRWVKQYNPDVIHLHNLHGYYINIEILFAYIKQSGKKIVWTLHDCWPFTGHASYCESAGCDNWKSGCHNCPNRNLYPASLVDHSKRNWKKKKEIFQGVNNLIIVTPSNWLSNLVSQSFLAEYEIKVIPNGVDTNIFRPIDTTKIRNKLHISNKTIVLGVAAIWDERKGLADFIELRNQLDDTYQIILVGLSKEQISKLPEGIMGIMRTDSVEQLAELYSFADVFVNPTYEDNYPTTNLETIACGTPVITYDTGGSQESAVFFGDVVKKHDIEGVVDKIKNRRIIKNKNINIGINNQINKFLKLYSSL